MASSPKLFRVDADTRASERLAEVEFSTLGFQERRDIQEWVANNSSILGDDLLIVDKEFDGFDRTNERLDLLAVDSSGALVIIELKRDDSGEDVHWQAIKYASYLRDATPDFVAQRLAEHRAFSSTEQAKACLSDHLDAKELSGLNHEQRIILASHRFAPEVTSAVLWLNEKVGAPLITCVTLTPFRDAETGALYVQASTIIPVRGADDYMVGVGGKAQAAGLTSKSSFAEKRQASFNRNSSDDVTRFVRKVAELAVEGLSSDVRPDRQGRWAAGWAEFRYFHLWYARPPWGNHVLCHQISLHRQENPDTWQVDVGFRDATGLILADLNASPVHNDQGGYKEGIYVTVGTDTLNDKLEYDVAEVLRQFIERITPKVNELQDEANVEEA